MVDLNEGTGAAGAYQVGVVNIGAMQETAAALVAQGAVSCRIKPPMERMVIDRSNPLCDGLVLDLGFNEGGGDTVRDLSGLGNDGTIQIGGWGTGEIGAQAEESTSDLSITISKVMNLAGQYNEFTIAFHAGMEAGSGKYVYKEEGSSGSIFGLLQSSYPRLYVRDDFGASIAPTFSTDVIWGTGIPHHVAYVTKSKITTCYVDGTQFGSPADWSSLGSMTNTNASKQWAVGNIPKGSCSYNLAWSRALTPREIADLYSDPWRIYRPLNCIDEE